MREKKQTTKDSEKKISRRSTVYLYMVTSMLLIFLIGGFLLIWKLMELQIFNADELMAKNMNQVQEKKVLQSPRGTIFDRHGRPLAVSAVTESLYADPKMITQTPEEIASLIAPYVDLSEEAIIAALKEDTAFVWLNRMMDKDKSDAVAKLIREHELIGLNFVEESKRFYPNGNVAAQAIGFVGIDDKGLDGLEMVLDDQIRGGVKKEVVATDQKGNPIFSSVLANFRPEKERTVTLTIDTTIQFIAERALDKAMEETKASGASIIIMDPKTGEILAMANRPTYDPNNFGNGNAQEFKNRAVVDIYEPGSTFKPIVAATALETGAWQLNEVFHDTGSFMANGEVIKNWDDESNGSVYLLDILKYSINTGMAHIGTKVGPTRLDEYAHKFGFGKVTDIELPGEGTGILFNPDDMQAIDVASMSIGQGIAVTPLQMVQAFGALANNGKMMKPHIIRSVNEPNGDVVYATEPMEVGNPVSSSVAEAITDILEKEVSEGGGNKAMVDGYRFAGKTGTAQKLNIQGGGYLNGRYISSFIGFGPVEDVQFVALIVIDDPSGVYYGGQIAAPVFKDIMSQLVRYYQISPTIMKSGTAPVVEETVVVPLRRNEDGDVILPDFTGWPLGEVRKWLQAANVVFKPVGSGFAVSQDEPGGTAVKENASVTVYFRR